MNTEGVDAYLRDGCGRCHRYRTADCKVLRWTAPLVALRALVRGKGLVETMKWGSPCYTVDGKNVVMLVSLVDACAVSFFQGAALVDAHGLLEAPGPHSRVFRAAKFRSLEEVSAQREALSALIDQAVQRAREGARIARPAAPEPMPEELAHRLAADPRLAAAFAALTPGRRRSHVLHVTGAKQAETRARRVDRCAEDILAGRGFRERPAS